MAHVIHSINITVGGSGHHEDAIADEEHHHYALDLLVSADAVLLGRNSFDLLASFWPGAVHRSDLPSHMTEFAAELEAKPKYVVTSRAAEVAWKNTTVLRGPDLDHVRRLVTTTPGTVVVFGSPGLGTSLASAGLVHEIHAVVQPFVGPVRVPAFPSVNARRKLEFIESRAFRSGAVLLRYEVARRVDPRRSGVSRGSRRSAASRDVWLVASRVERPA